MINTNVLVTILCGKDKTNQQNEAPLYLRIMLNKQRKLISLKEHINIEYWDFTLNHIKPHYPNKEYLELIINEAKQKIDKTVLSFKLANKSFAIDDLIESTSKKKSQEPQMTVKQLFDGYIEELFEQERIKNAKYYCCCLNCLMKFREGKDLFFSEIDASFLTDYSNWMKKKKLHTNTIGNRLRGLKAIYNQAIVYKYIAKDSSPFETFKVNKFRIETTKRVIDKADIQTQPTTISSIMILQEIYFYSVILVMELILLILHI